MRNTSTSAPRPSPTERHRHKCTPRVASAIHHPYPVANETNAGGVALSVKDRWAYVAVTARRNRGGRLERRLPKGRLGGAKAPEETAVRKVSKKTNVFGRVLTHLASIGYWFSSADHRVRKVVHHFPLEALSGFLTVENNPDQGTEKVE